MYQIIEAKTRRPVLIGLTLDQAAQMIRTTFKTGHYFAPVRV